MSQIGLPGTSGDEPEFVRLRKEKQALDLERHRMHLSFFSALSDDRVALARKLINDVLDRWDSQRSCGAYYIAMWRNIANAESMADAYANIPVSEAAAMATNSPIMHGFHGGKKIMEIVNAHD